VAADGNDELHEVGPERLDESLPVGGNGPLVEEEHAAVCALCGHDYEFVMPTELVEASVQGDLVVFAGAGISTENGSVFPHTFYEQIKAQTGGFASDASFPEVMSAFQEQYGRLRLIQEALKRLQYAEKFPSLKHFASRFHQELATISGIQEIVTTNWDSLFEDKCGALPIVVDGDYAYYHLKGRKVYKIHGSVRNISTIVATSEDYAETEERLRSSAIGGTLRHLLATKTIVFIGYSLRDDDFRNVYSPLMEGMGQLRPISYYVSPVESAEAAEFGLRHIRTDGTHFIRSLKEHLCERGVQLPDKVIDRSSALLFRVRQAHKELGEMEWRTKFPLVFSFAYQDGLLDALNRIIAQHVTGEYTSTVHVTHLIHSYEVLLERAVSRGKYWDAAYVNGYMAGLVQLLIEDEDLVSVPLFELFDDPAYWPEGPTDREEAKRDEGLRDEGQGEDGATEEVPDETPDATAVGALEELLLGEELDPFKILPRLTSESELLDMLDGLAEHLPLMAAAGREAIESVPSHLVPQHFPFLGDLLHGDDLGE
jgi:NAD-dependent SIR2 family protein deacetylase